MRVAVPNPSAEDLVGEPQRGTSKPGRTLPDLRLIRGEARTNATPSGPRLAVILAADTVEYTRHMAEDEAGTHARCMALHRTIVEPGIARHGARIFKNTGDGFMAEFLSATQAVWFAVKFQHAVRTWNARRRRLRSLEFRVGINLGDVIVEPQDVFGHTVNVASRLEAVARPGGVLVSQAVSASVRDPRLLFEDAGDLALRNVADTVRGFHVTMTAPARPHRSRAMATKVPPR